MRYRVLACDYDGTLADGGRMHEATVAALERFRASGRRLVLVTGRELDDLIRVCPELKLFERVVAENGAVLHDPAAHESRALGQEPAADFVDALRRRGVAPLSVGRVIVATWHPNEHIVLETIRDLGLELHVIFNKGAVMVLPSGISKETGLAAALEELGLSPHNTAGIGDAENDHAFLGLCECSAAVANALPSLLERVDLVTARDHGGGVIELIDRILETDLAELAPALTRHQLLLGQSSGGESVCLTPYGETIMVAGPSGAGKSTITRWILELLAARKYQFCVIDPEGDYYDLPHAVALHGEAGDALIDDAMHVLTIPSQSVVLSLVDIALEERPPFFQRLMARLQELRARTGRPHWLVVDEAHHLLPRPWQPSGDVLSSRIGSLLMITVHPEHVSAAALALVDSIVAVGDDAGAVAEAVGASRAGGGAPPRPDAPGRWVCLFRRSERAIWVKIPDTQQERLRHRRKYAEGKLGTDKSFYFRGPDARLNLRAQNLGLFNQIADGVDDETWLHHLRRGEYSRWFRESIRDEGLASEAAAVENDHELSATDSRARIREAIEARYTSPA